jgi:uncharacterized protein
MKRLLSSLTILVCFVIAVTGQVGGVRPSVSVIGEAETSVAPDQVSFTLEIVTANKDLAPAKQSNDAAAERTLTIAKSFNISPDDIQTDSLTVTPKYTGEKDPRGSRVLIGYEVTKRVNITLKELAKIDAFLSRVIEAGVNRIVGINIENSQFQKYQEQVRAAAVANARSRAAAYAKQLGQTIGKAYVIREDGADDPAYFSARGYGNGSGNGDGVAELDNPSLSLPNAFSREVTFALGKITVSEKIYVTFELQR